MSMKLIPIEEDEKYPFCPKCKVALYLENKCYSEYIKKQMNCTHNGEWILTETIHATDEGIGDTLCWEKICDKCGIKDIEITHPKIDDRNPWECCSCIHYWVKTSKIMRCPKCVKQYLYEDIKEE